MINSVLISSPPVSPSTHQSSKIKFIFSPKYTQSRFFLSSGNHRSLFLTPLKPLPLAKKPGSGSHRFLSLINVIVLHPFAHHLVDLIPCRPQWYSAWSHTEIQSVSDPGALWEPSRKSFEGRGVRLLYFSFFILFSFYFPFFC